MDKATRQSFKDEYTIDFVASRDVLKSLDSLGRTEDVKFSPSNRRLALTGYKTAKLLILDVQIVISDRGAQVTLTDFVELTSPSLRGPHGLAFLNDQTLLVVNRWGTAPIFKIPSGNKTEKHFDVRPLFTIGAADEHQLESPGSVSVSRLDNEHFEVLICNNYVHNVTRHILAMGEHPKILSSEKLLSKGLVIPDGVAVTSDNRWIAISNHSRHCVFLYENTAKLHQKSRPDGVLRNINYPHGVLFTPDNNYAIVADAGSPYVNIYAVNGNSWKGARNPRGTVRVMEEETYLRGRINSQEGGPKGIDIDNSASVLVATCDEQLLTFFDLPAMLRRQGVPLDRRKKSIVWRYERIRDELRRLRGWK